MVTLGRKAGSSSTSDTAKRRPGRFRKKQASSLGEGGRQRVFGSVSSLVESHTEQRQSLSVGQARAGRGVGLNLGICLLKERASGALGCLGNIGMYKWTVKEKGWWPPQDGQSDTQRDGHTRASRHTERCCKPHRLTHSIRSPDSGRPAGWGTRLRRRGGQRHPETGAQVWLRQADGRHRLC